MGLPRVRPLPGILLAVTMLAELGAVGLSWGLEPAYDTLFSALFTLLIAGTGALILSRHPRHAVGWLLCVLGLANALTADLPQGWGLRAAAEGWAGALRRSGSGCGRSFCRGRCSWRSSCCSPLVTCPTAAGPTWCGCVSPEP